MNLLVGTPTFHGALSVPSSKSHTIRALLCAALADEPSVITAPLISADTVSALEVLRLLGVSVIELSKTPLTLKIIPPAGGLLSSLDAAAQNGRSSQNDGTSGAVDSRIGTAGTISGSQGAAASMHEMRCNDSLQGMLTLDLGNSGSLLYFLGVLLAAAKTPVRLTGDESLRQRPVEPLTAVYRQADIPYTAARPENIEPRAGGNASGPVSSSGAAPAVPPLTFCGPLPAGAYRLTGPFSQPVTGLLLTAPLLHGLTRIVFHQAGERPYLKMTCAWLHTAGITVINKDEQYFEIPGGQRYRAFSTTVPGDWSSALFPLTAAVVCNAALTLTNLDPADTQGDIQALSVLQAMGADIRCDPERRTVSVHPITGSLRGGSFCCADIPDAVPALAAAALFCTDETVLTQAGVCRFKECDRLSAAAEELAKFGARITQGNDFLRIEGSGGACLHPARVWSRKDHRIAMMLAVAACGIARRHDSADGVYQSSCIEDFDCVTVSYPSFVEDMNIAGAALTPITGRHES